MKTRKAGKTRGSTIRGKSWGKTKKTQGKTKKTQGKTKKTQGKTKGGMFSLSKLFSKSTAIARSKSKPNPVIPVINKYSAFSSIKKKIEMEQMEKQMKNDLNIIKNIYENMKTFNFTDIYSQEIMNPPRLEFNYEGIKYVTYIESLIKILTSTSIGENNITISSIKEHIKTITAFNTYIYNINDSSKQKILHILYYIKILNFMIYFKSVFDEFVFDNKNITYYNIYDINEVDHNYMHENQDRYRTYIDNYIYYIKYILFTNYNQIQYNSINTNALYGDYIIAKNDCGICTEDQSIYECNPKSKTCDNFCKYPTVNNVNYEECKSYNNNKPLLTDPSDITAHFIGYLDTYYTKDIFNEFAKIVIEYIIGFCEYIDNEKINENTFKNKYNLTVNYIKRDSIIKLLENYKKEIKRIMDKYNVIYDNNMNKLISTNQGENSTLTSILQNLNDIYMFTKQNNVSDLSKTNNQLSRLLFKLSDIHSLLMLSSNHSNPPVKPLKPPRPQSLKNS